VCFAKAIFGSFNVEDRYRNAIADILCFKRVNEKRLVRLGKRSEYKNSPR